MRASATSKIASPANLHASQARTNANKADEASPFAMLVSAAPKEPAKPHRKDAGDAADKQPEANAKPIAKRDHASQTKQDGKADAAQQAKQAKSAQADKPASTDKPAPADQPVQTDTSEKSDKADDRIGDEAAAQAGSDADKPVVAADLPPADAPAPQPMLASVPQAPLAPANGDGGKIQTDAAGTPPATAVSGATPGAPAQASASATAQASVSATAQASASATAQADDADDAEAPAQTSVTTPLTADAKPAAHKSDDAKAAAAKPAIKTAAADNAANDPADAGKTDAPKIQPDTASPAKTDTGGEAKASQPDIASFNDASKPAPVQALNGAANGVAAPQAPQAATPVTQYVQVTAQQPAPNLTALAVHIAARSQSGARQFDIRLDPPELGRVDVRLSIDATGKTSAHLSADRPQTLDLLQKDSTSLTRALRDAGLDVSQDGLNFSLRQQGHDGAAGNSGHRGAPRAFSLTATTSIDATATSAAYRSLADGRVDIRV